MFRVVSQSAVHLQSFAFGSATRGDGHAVEVGFSAVGEREVERLVVVLLDVGQAVVALLLHSEPCGQIRQTRNDALRIL